MVLTMREGDDVDQENDDDDGDVVDDALGSLPILPENWTITETR